jgi:hypothetical protein
MIWYLLKFLSHIYHLAVETQEEDWYYNIISDDDTAYECIYENLPDYQANLYEEFAIHAYKELLTFDWSHVHEEIEDPITGEEVPI